MRGTTRDGVDHEEGELGYVALVWRNWQPVGPGIQRCSPEEWIGGKIPGQPTLVKNPASSCLITHLLPVSGQEEKNGHPYRHPIGNLVQNQRPFMVHHR